MDLDQKPVNTITLKPLAKAVALCCALASSTTSATTFHVRNINDSGLGSLRQAVINANTSPGEDQITFEPELGTITLNSGQIDITEALIITGPTVGQNITVDILGSPGRASRIFGVTVNDQTLTLENLTLSGGRTSGEDRAQATCDSTDARGAAVCALGDLVLINSVVSKNSTFGRFAYGGGVYARKATLINCFVTSNRTFSPKAQGGGLYARAALLRNSIVSDNQADYGYGGGLSAMSVTLIDSSVIHNKARKGGGVFATNASVINSTISSNGANETGAGLFVQKLDKLTNSTITNNTAIQERGAGGGGLFLADINSVINIDSTILAGNVRGSGIGAVIDNVASDGGSVTINLSNSLFGDPATEVTGINHNNSLTDDAGLAPLAHTGCKIPAGLPGQISCVPTHALLADSPALNAGNNPEVLETDERGLNRVADGQIDIGAFERQPEASTVLTAGAATFQVTNRLDFGRGSLRQAVVDANSHPGDDRIVFKPGLDVITLSSGQIEITDTISIVGPTQKQTISGDGISRVFSVLTPEQDLVLENMNISDGNCSVFQRCAGGAIYSPGKLTLSSTVVTNSSATRGGGISANTITLTNSQVSANQTRGYGNGDGGGISASIVTLTNSTVSNNHTSKKALADGGGIDAKTVTLTDSTISNNHTLGDRARGGGIRAFTVTLTNSKISNNYTVGNRASGGGIWVDSVTLANSVISNNHTQGEYARGGGVMAISHASVTNSTISNNHTVGNEADGGGLYIRDGATLTNSTISNNSTQGSGADGGGVYHRANPLNTVLTVTNSTITQNKVTGSTAYGGGLFNDPQNANVDLHSTILAGNTGSLGVVDNLGFRYFDSAVLNVSNSVFGDPVSNITGTNQNNIFTNQPGLVMLTDNGCDIPAGAADSAACVETHALLSGSPALDAGDNSENLDADQRGNGFFRVVDSQADIGAFERQTGSVTDDNSDDAILFTTTFEVNHLWRRVNESNIPNQSSAKPQLFGYSPATFNGGQEGVVRIKTADTNQQRSLLARFQEFTYLDQFHVKEQIGVFGFAAGVTSLDDGTKIIAGSFPLTGNRLWHTVSFLQSFASTPRLFLFAQTSNGGQPVILRARQVTNTNFEVALDEEEQLRLSGHVIEQIAYFAIDSPSNQGSLNINGSTTAYSLRQVAVNHNWVSIFGRQIKLQEERSRDQEILHLNELVDVMMLGGQMYAQSVSDNGADPFSIRIR